MKLIHLSDIHLVAPGRDLLGLDPEARLIAALDHIVAHHGDADRVVISGDLTDAGEPAAYAALSEALAERLAGHDLPVRLMVGNHDLRAPFLEAFPDQPHHDSGYVMYAEDLPEGRLIYCDTVDEGRHSGRLCATRIDWLEAQIAGADRAFVFLHHNPLDLGDPASDTYSLAAEDQAALRRVLARQGGRVAHLFFGHVHGALSGVMQGVPFSGVPSTVHQVIPKLAPSDYLSTAALQPAYRVILTRGADVVIHQIPFDWQAEVTEHDLT